MLRVKCNWLATGSVPGVSILHFDGEIATDASSAVSKVESFWDDAREWFASSTSMQVDPEVFHIDPETGEVTDVFTATVGAALPGTSATAPVPQAAQVLLTTETDARRYGRKVRGHWYLPGFAVGGMGQGEVGTGPRAAIETVGNGVLFSALAGLGVWSRPDLIRGRAGAFTPGVRAVVWNEFATLRKRRS